jgi:hypothetical protein
LRAPARRWAVALTFFATSCVSPLLLVVVHGLLICNETTTGQGTHIQPTATQTTNRHANRMHKLPWWATLLTASIQLTCVDFCVIALRLVHVQVIIGVCCPLLAAKEACDLLLACGLCCYLFGPAHADSQCLLHFRDVGFCLAGG